MTDPYAPPPDEQRPHEQPPAPPRYGTPQYPQQPGPQQPYPQQPYPQQPPQQYPQQPYGQPSYPQQPFGQPPYQQQQYGPPPGSPGYRPPPSINVASILLFISGGFGVLGGLLLFAVSSIAAWVAVVAVIVLAIALVEIYTGLQFWARTATIVLAGLAVLFGLVSLFNGGYTSIIGIALDVYVIVLMYRPDTLSAFPASTRPGGI
jgi:hypothetical protein